MQQINQRLKKLEDQVDFSGYSDRELCHIVCEHPSGSLKIDGTYPSLYERTTDTDRAEWAKGPNRIADPGYHMARVTTPNVPEGCKAVRAHCTSCGLQGLLFDVANTTREQYAHYLDLLDANDHYEGGQYKHADFYAYELIQAGHLDFVAFTPEIKAYYEAHGARAMAKFGTFEWESKLEDQ